MARTKKKLEIKPIVPVPTAKAYEARNMYPKYIKPEVKPMISSCERDRGARSAERHNTPRIGSEEPWRE